MKYVYAALIGLCALGWIMGSCSTGDAAAQILGASSEAPVFLSCTAVSETELDFQFSLPVRVVSLHFSPALAVDSVADGATVRVNLAEDPGPGTRITADLLVEDPKGNTMNVLIPLRTRNSRIPALLINELRTEYSKPKPEYIEFKIVSAGNLGALRVIIAGNYKKPLVYEFGPAEVGAGDYVLLHLRTIDEACRDEYGADLNESGGVDAVAGVRDIWIPGSSKLLHKTDAVYVLDQDDQVIDAVMMAENPGAWWNKDYFAEAAEWLFSQGAWQSADGAVCAPPDAVDTTSVKSAATRSVSRNEAAADTNTAADWHVTATSGITPGKPNK